MPVRLRPCAPFTPDAILVGDPGRAMLLAQELLDEPKMCNHARGLWGYSGRTPEGAALTVQSTGMGGPSAALVLEDLAELGIRQAVRVGTCTALSPGLAPGAALLVKTARHGDGGLHLPDAVLTEALAALSTDNRGADLLSLDRHLFRAAEASPHEAEVADMQTAALLARAPQLGIAIATLTIVSRGSGGDLIDDEELENAAKVGGRLAAAALTVSRVERDPGQTLK